MLNQTTKVPISGNNQRLVIIRNLLHGMQNQFGIDIALNLSLCAQQCRFKDQNIAE